MFHTNFSTDWLISILLTIPGVLLALSVHECAHGWMSYKLGDPTARNFGRLTLNPIKHIDPMGLLCMIFAGFGWAKPVPVNARYYKKPRRDMALVAAAGPISNLIMSVIGLLLVFIIYFIYQSVSADPIHFNFLFLSAHVGIAPQTDDTSIKIMYLLFLLLVRFARLNIGLAVFNLIPIPPLDGSRIAFIFLPPKFYFGVMRYERYIQIAMFALLFLGAFDGILADLSYYLLVGILYLIQLIPIFRF
jgi:Zn-dependent protease